MKYILVVLMMPLLLLVSCSKEQPKVESKIDAKPEQSITQHEEKTGAMMVADAKKNLQEAKAKLAEEGKYNCCIKEPCSMCALAHGECDCYNDLKKGEHVCVECYAGWQQGKGADNKIKPEDVKTSFLKHEHEH